MTTQDQDKQAILIKIRAGTVTEHMSQVSVFLFDVSLPENISITIKSRQIAAAKEEVNSLTVGSCGGRRHIVTRPILLGGSQFFSPEFFAAFFVDTDCQ